MPSSKEFNSRTITPNQIAAKKIKLKKQYIKTKIFTRKHYRQIYRKMITIENLEIPVNVAKGFPKKYTKKLKKHNIKIKKLTLIK